jgi:hypothetical protein
MAFKSCNHPIKIYISSFPLRLLCILIRLAKLQYTYQESIILICMLMIVFLFIVRLTLSSLLWCLPYLRYYEVYPLFIIMRLTLSSLMCSCFLLHNSNSILLFFANHAFFKYDKPINMKFHHSSLHNLNPNCSTCSDTLNQFNTFHSCIIS